MVDNSIKISITGKLTYSDEITISQATQIVAFLNPDENGEGADLGGSLLEGSSKSKKAKQVENAREAIEISGALKNPEKIVALGAYVLQDGGETFKAEDVKAQFRRARETAPGNFTRDLSLAIANGWIAEDAPGEYYLTNKVEGILGGGFSFSKSGGATKTSRARATAPKKAKVTSSKPEVFASIDEFPIVMDGFPPYSKLKTNRDKMLWVVQFAKNQGINGLSNKAIEWLTDHLGDGVPNKQISAAFNTAKTPNGYVNRSTQDQSIRITEAGQAYLAGLATDN
jgi:hypothetical protein